eukprot:GILI01048166.1.p1 GENE.GILI01048166.1~~GILI01048166.1.p1  ORF type:complete len:188 (+),score=16.95 GILI01048166.1:59-622(+)
MSFSGATGRGTFQSIIAGTAQARRWSNTYFSLAPQLLELRNIDQEIRKRFFVRDKQFDSRFSAGQALNGSFKHLHFHRQNQHIDEIMPAIRRRTMLLGRIRRQRAINEDIIKTNAAEGRADPRDVLASADAAVYFAPKLHKGTVAQPNYWQHESNSYVVPKVHWRRHPELGGITRVHNELPKYLSQH